ncbi:ribbon-helix-helix protein, CopG family [Flavonifractor sp. An4]|nr:ribbon-helix-helix protein, CopG family [Flavonifractor sp. An4]
MDETKRVQISLRSDVLERLDVLAREMGLKRSAVLSLLIKEKWKEEHTD